MIRETFQCVKQVGDVLPVREGTEIADISVEEKNDDNNFVLHFVVSGWKKKDKLI